MEPDTNIYIVLAAQTYQCNTIRHWITHNMVHVVGHPTVMAPCDNGSTAHEQTEQRNKLFKETMLQ